MNKIRLWFLFYCLSLFAIGNANNNENIDSLHRILTTTTDAKNRIKALFSLSDSLRSKNPNQALIYNQEAYNLAIKAGEDKDAVYSLLNMVEISYTMSDLKNSMQYAFTAMEIAEEKGLKMEQAIILDHMGMIYYDIGNKQKCSNVYFESLKIYESLNEKVGICKDLSWIGLLYYDQHNYDKSWEYYSKSLKIARKMNSQEGIAANLNNLAKVLVSKNMHKDALEYFEESLKINKKLNEPYAIASNYLNIGTAHSSLKEYTTALDYYSKAMDLFKSVSNQVRIASTRIKMGETYLEMNNLDESIQNSKIALNIGQENDYQDIIYRSSKLLHKIYLIKHDTIVAYKFSVIENQIRDSLQLNAKSKNLASLELQYLLEKKEQEARIARQRNKIFIIGGFIFMAFGIIIILLILNQFRLKAKKAKLEKINLEQELDFKKKELILNVMSLMKQNEMFAEITRKILEYESHIQQPESLEILKTIGNKVRKSNEKEGLKEFSLRFKEVHKDFYDALLTNFPNLTPNELRLCAFLKLNMTTKEISELTGQQLNTLEHARYILRQKLKISNSDINLVTFLSQI
jgi:tetratricopeptide (TPR) repeat protein